MNVTDILRSGTSRRLAATAVAVAAVAGPQAAGLASAATDPSCADVQVVFARGTFEAPGVGDTGQAFVDALTSRLPGKAIDVYGVNYPASLHFSDATEGIADASHEIETTVASCPNTKIVLGGYSQGAAVAGYTTADAVPAGFTLPADISGPMPPAVAPHVAAVVMFGTPSPFFLGLVDHSAPPLTIGPLYANKTLQLCAQGDPVCYPGGLDRSAHSAYEDNGMADQAAAYAAAAITGTAPADGAA